MPERMGIEEVHRSAKAGITKESLECPVPLRIVPTPAMMRMMNCALVRLAIKPPPDVSGYVYSMI